MPAERLGIEAVACIVVDDRVFEAVAEHDLVFVKVEVRAEVEGVIFIPSEKRRTVIAKVA
jgi:hypothetical protein